MKSLTMSMALVLIVGCLTVNAKNMGDMNNPAEIPKNTTSSDMNSIKIKETYENDKNEPEKENKKDMLMSSMTSTTKKPKNKTIITQMHKKAKEKNETKYEKDENNSSDEEEYEEDEEQENKPSSTTTKPRTSKTSTTTTAKPKTITSSSFIKKPKTQPKQENKAAKEKYDEEDENQQDEEEDDDYDEEDPIDMMAGFTTATKKSKRSRGTTTSPKNQNRGDSTSSSSSTTPNPNQLDEDLKTLMEVCNKKKNIADEHNSGENRKHHRHGSGSKKDRRRLKHLCRELDRHQQQEKQQKVSDAIDRLGSQLLDENKYNMEYPRLRNLLKRLEDHFTSHKH